MSERIRIAYLITDLDVGGAERNLATLAKGLDRTRFDVSVASLMPPGKIGRELADGGTPVVDLHMASRADLLALPRLLRWIKQVRPGILHTWLFHANVLGRCAGRFAGVPVVVSSIRVAEPRRWHLALERMTSRLADRILTNSPSLRDYMVAHGIKAGRLAVIPNAVDLAKFAAERREADDVPVALFIGRLTEQKGVDVLLQAAARLSERCGIRIDIAGDGPDREKLERLAGDLKLANVRFLGQSDRVPELLAQADLFVLPSRWEGLPNAVLEAMAARCPVVGTDVTGTRDLITDGHNGLLVPCEDPAALAAAIERLIRDRALSGSLALNGLETARKHSAQAMIEAHEALYLTLLERR